MSENEKKMKKKGEKSNKYQVAKQNKKEKTRK